MKAPFLLFGVLVLAILATDKKPAKKAVVKAPQVAPVFIQPQPALPAMPVCPGPNCPQANCPCGPNCQCGPDCKCERRTLVETPLADVVPKDTPRPRLGWRLRLFSPPGDVTAAWLRNQIATDPWLNEFASRYSYQAHETTSDEFKKWQRNGYSASATTLVLVNAEGTVAYYRVGDAIPKDVTKLQHALYDASIGRTCDGCNQNTLLNNGGRFRIRMR